MAVSFIGGGNRSVRENHRPVASHWQTLSQNVVSSTPPLNGIQTHNVSGNIGTDCIGSCKSNYHTITAIWVCCISLYMLYWNKSDFNVRNLLTVEGSFHISSNLTMACVSKRFVSWPNNKHYPVMYSGQFYQCWQCETCELHSVCVLLMPQHRYTRETPSVIVIPFDGMCWAWVGCGYFLRICPIYLVASRPSLIDQPYFTFDFQLNMFFQITL
jgi:hypothetical protein